MEGYKIMTMESDKFFAIMKNLMETCKSIITENYKIKIVFTVLFVVFILLLENENVKAFAQMGDDKYKAKAHRWRIKEAALLLPAFWGGGLGIWKGMNHFNHKTRKSKFRWGVPVLFFLELLILGGVVYLILGGLVYYVIS
jgi:uncharacterized membrane protein YsdA (DUF1294 family)